MWLLWHGKVLTNVERKRRHMIEDDIFPLCATSLEFLAHALRDCSFASNIWKPAPNSGTLSLFFSLSFHDWLNWNL